MNALQWLERRYGPDTVLDGISNVFFALAGIAGLLMLITLFFVGQNKPISGEVWVGAGTLWISLFMLAGLTARGLGEFIEV